LHRLSNNKNDEEEEANNRNALTGCTPAHLLCKQNPPTMSLVHFFSLRDPKAFLLCDQQGRCALHLVAIFSESLELLQSMLQIDHTMTNRRITSAPVHGVRTALGLLYKRLEFPRLKEMITSLIEVDSSVAVIYDGIIGCILRAFSDNIRGTGAERILDRIKVLLNANPEAAKHNNSTIFHEACSYVTGQLGIAVLTFFLTKNVDGFRSLSIDGSLPIHHAAGYATVDMLIFLHQAYPESLSILNPDKCNLLHLAIDEENDRIAKLEYLCYQCPQLIHKKDDEGVTPLHDFLRSCHNKVDFKAVKFLCDADETVVRDKCTPSFKEEEDNFDCLPLHLLIYYRSVVSDLSDEADCFRLFLRLHPSSAGMKDRRLKSPYDLAVEKNLKPYFIRLLLANDPTIDPVKRKDLNFEARREGMFLAFRALSTTLEPTIWAQLRYENVNLLARVISYL
jgi:hypothetical protein